MMIKQRLLSFGLSIGLALGAASGAYAAGASGKVKDYDFSFEGPFGKFDQFQLQRGLQVYTEVCAACHGLQYLYFRNLTDEGGPALPEDQVKAYATEYFVYDAEIDEEREAGLADRFPAVDGAGAPDLTLMAKARAGFHGPMGSGINQLVKGMGGAEYIASLLSGYTGEEKEEAGTILYENTAFPGGWISMAPPLDDDLVEFQDGHSASVEDMSKDVAAFLMWTAEPKMMARKQFGFTSVLLLGLLAVLLYLTNKKIWAPIKRKSA